MILEGISEEEAVSDELAAGARDLLTQASEASISSDEPSSASLTIFTLEQLTQTPYPSGVDTSKREEYLSDSDFKSALGMDKEAFSNLPAWKKSKLKKSRNLF